MQFIGLSPTATRRPLPSSVLPQDLRKELIHWKFLDSWEGFLPWRDERHLHLRIFSDASFSGRGATLQLPGSPPSKSCGYWDESTRGLSIAAKESRALLNAVQSLLGQTFNARVDVLSITKFCWIAGRSKFPNLPSFQTPWRIYFFSRWFTISPWPLCNVPGQGPNPDHAIRRQAH